MVLFGILWKVYCWKDSFTFPLCVLHQSTPQRHLNFDQQNIFFTLMFSASFSQCKVKLHLNPFKSVYLSYPNWSSAGHPWFISSGRLLWSVFFFILHGNWGIAKILVGWSAAQVWVRINDSRSQEGHGGHHNDRLLAYNFLMKGLVHSRPK